VLPLLQHAYTNIYADTTNTDSGNFIQRNYAIAFTPRTHARRVSAPADIASSPCVASQERPQKRRRVDFADEAPEDNVIHSSRVSCHLLFAQAFTNYLTGK
jgi:hypothetical protein